MVLVAELDGIEVGDLPLLAERLLSLFVAHPDATFKQPVELADDQIVGITPLELLRAHPEVSADDPLIGLGSQELPVLVGEGRVFQDRFPQLLVGDPDPHAFRFLELELSVDEVARRLAGEINLRSQLVPPFPVELGESLVKALHFREELLLGNRAVADADRRPTSAGPSGTAGAPVHEDQKHENGYHTPEDELEVSQIVA